MISILMPIYNGIEFIDDSVMSVLSQTYDKWELVIGVNGHPLMSNVFLTAKKYEEIDTRIKVYDMYDIKGKSNALNKMLEYTNYNYIAILDVDDIWYNKKIEIQIHYIINYDVVGTYCEYFGEQTGIPYIPGGSLETFNFGRLNPIINSSAIIRKDLCYWDSKWWGIEDYDLWLRLHKLNKKLYNVPIVLVKHRIHKQSAFNAKGNNNDVKTLLRKYGYI